MKTLNVPTTNTRKRLFAAAEKAGWAEGDDGPAGDQLVKGDFRINVGYDRSGRIQAACLYGPKDHPNAASDGEMGFTARFAEIILWIGSV